MSIGKRTVNLLISIVIALILISIAVVLLWPEDIEQTIAEEVMATLPGSAFGKIDNFTYTKSDRGRVQWQIKAERAEYFQDDNRAVLNTLEAIFYDEEGRIFTLQGARGEMNTETQDITVSGGITASTSEGYQLVTNSAYYNKEQGIVTTDDPVLFFGEGITVHAVGMEVKIEDQHVTLKQAVRALIEEGSDSSNVQPET